MLVENLLNLKVVARFLVESCLDEKERGNISHHVVD